MSLTAIHAEPCPLYESMLISIHEQAETWLLKFAQMNIKMVPGNLHTTLQTFEGGEVDEVSQRCTYTMQHDPTTLLVELKKAFVICVPTWFLLRQTIQPPRWICYCILLEGFDA